MKKLFINVIMLSLLLILSFGCSSGGGSSDGTNICDGPVPCLNSSWGYIDSTGSWNGDFAVFMTPENEEVVVISDGINVVIAINFENFIAALGGEPVNCYDANLFVGGEDINKDGVIDYTYDSISAKLNICGINLKLYDLIIEGNNYFDESAVFVEMIHSDKLIKGLSVNSFTNKNLSNKNIAEIEIKMMLVEELYIKEF